MPISPSTIQQSSALSSINPQSTDISSAPPSKNGGKLKVKSVKSSQIAFFSRLRQIFSGAIDGKPRTTPAKRIPNITYLKQPQTIDQLPQEMLEEIPKHFSNLSDFRSFAKLGPRYRDAAFRGFRSLTPEQRKEHWFAAIDSFGENAADHLENIRFFNDSGVLASDVNAANAQGRTALMFAAHRGQSDVVRELLNASGIDLNAANDQGYWALVFARIGGHSDVARMLWNARAALSMQPTVRATQP